MIHTESIQKKFSKMKADFKVNARRNNNTGTYTVDVRRGTFMLNGHEEVLNNMEVTVVDTDIKDRHLLINVKTFFPKRKGGGFDFTNDKWLCGHDERDWFVGAIPQANVINIAQAKRSLKPADVLAAERGIKGKKANARKNKARIRQGEWFFIPMAENFTVKPSLIHKNEPISRGRRSKPHIVQELYREGGVQVWVSNKFPSGVDEAQYQVLNKTKEHKNTFHVMTRDASAYARGTVRHKDHATIHLVGWHRIMMNTEAQSRTMKNLVFLD